MITYFRKIYKIIKNSKKIFNDPNHLRKYELGNLYHNNPFHKEGEKKNIEEITKEPKRYDIINFLLKLSVDKTKYLEIGVRFPEHNFNKVMADEKYSVDPGFENKNNSADYKFTSDEFFKKLNNKEILNSAIKFDVIFIDGLHLAEQVEKDILNALTYIKPNGFIVLHDCNPPTALHASELYQYRLSPSLGNWNGTTWKAFYKYRSNKELYSCCVDTDWGIGIISKTIKVGEKTNTKNPFFEYNILNATRKDSLGLVSFDELKSRIKAS